MSVPLQPHEFVALLSVGTVSGRERLGRLCGGGKNCGKTYSAQTGISNGQYANKLKHTSTAGGRGG
jgi:hypothetical protein